MDAVVHLKTDLPEWHTMQWDCVIDYDDVLKFETLLKYMGIECITKAKDVMDGHVICGDKVTVGYWAWPKDNAIVKSAFMRYLESKEEK